MPALADMPYTVTMTTATRKLSEPERGVVVAALEGFYRDCDTAVAQHDESADDSTKRKLAVIRERGALAKELVQEFGGYADGIEIALETTHSARTFEDVKG